MNRIIGFFCGTYLCFALAATYYTLVAIQLEERERISKHPESADDRRQAPIICGPFGDFV